MFTTVKSIEVNTSLGNTDNVRVTVDGKTSQKRYTRWAPTFWYLETSVAHQFIFEHENYQTVVIETLPNELPREIRAEMVPKENE